MHEPPRLQPAQHRNTGLQCAARARWSEGPPSSAVGRFSPAPDDNLAVGAPSMIRDEMADVTLAPDNSASTSDSPQPAARRFAHNPALDGLRGAAVLVVVLYHTGLLVGGWIGVEMFFVLSGYLITSLLTIEIDTTGRIDLIAFW